VPAADTKGISSQADALLAVQEQSPHLGAVWHAFV
jgi:hypothetical protein